jgi:hypothetical protein
VLNATHPIQQQQQQHWGPRHTQQGLGTVFRTKVRVWGTGVQQATQLLLLLLAIVAAVLLAGV